MESGVHDCSKEHTMEAQTTDDFGHPSPPARFARSATVVAAIYLALVVGSPLIVRYGPSPDDHAMAALATRMETPSCVAAPALGFPCGGTTLAARNVRPAEEPDL
jgi:hypothetical protein